MFAVPGWAVSPASLVQEKRAAKSEPNRPSSEGHSADGQKKRKSTHNQHEDQSSKKISGRELERLWNQRFGKVQQKKPRGRDADATTTASKQQDASKVTVKNADDAVQESSKKTNKQSSKNNQNNKNKQQKEEVQEEHRNPKDNLKKKNGSNEEDVKRSASTATSAKNATTVATIPSAPQVSTSSSTTTKLTPLQAKMRSKLTSARFRHLNETLYTTTSSSAMELFTNSPDLFCEYNAGFSQQVKESWPQNPVDQYIRSIKSRGQATTTLLPLPRRKTGSCTIADLGCGDAPLARGCQSQIKNLQLKFHNFDLHAPNSHVTKADISNLPLRDGEADIVIFCLSLMGTNWPSFVEEAWRVLRGDGKGEVWVAEVKSRFGRVTRNKGGPGHVVENSVGKRRKMPKPKPEDELTGEEIFLEDSEAANAADATDISAFTKVFARRGFVLREDSVDKSNKMFVSMVFVKSGVPTAGKHKGLKWNGHEYQKIKDSNSHDDDIPPEEEAKTLKPCVYKTR